ncbi:N-acetylmuramoyl-L-alanine amidase [Viridibacillus arvi]|uniref:N-acetylmuramoyl-L-alanine amidase n=1 Tax=Viridibacillus arvi TaxID=263475 RepID=UPI0034CDC19D
MTKTVVISGGHYGPYTGASDIVDEVTEAWKISKQVAKLLRAKGITVHEFYDTVSKNQNDNLNRIVAFHNSKKRDLDLSFHLNSTVRKAEGIGCETLYYDAVALAKKITDAICVTTGFKNRGAKERRELAFLRGTNEPAVLLEPFFVSSVEDVRIYEEKFNVICEAIANAVAEHLGVKISTVSKPVSKPSTSNNEGYYKKGTGLYRIKKACIAYDGVVFGNSKKVQALKVNEKYTIVDIVKVGSAYRLKTKSGLYITAKKEYVEKV